MLRRRVRLRDGGQTPGQRRRRNQRLSHFHEAIRQDQRGAGVEERTGVERPSQVFHQRGPVRPAVPGPEE